MHYKIQGTPNSPVLIFSNSLGAEMMMWDELVPFLLPYFQVLQYDTRGHGGSKEETSSNGYTIAQLSRDVIDLMDQLNIDTAYFCGLSMGGLIGQYLGIHYPGRFKKIVLSNTAAKIGTEERWNTRIATIKSHGMASIVEDTMARWFTVAFRDQSPNHLEAIHAMFLRNDLQGYSNCCIAIRDADFRETLGRLNVPTLVVTGSEDEVTNVQHAEFLAEKIPDANLAILPARHIPSIEMPETYAKLLIEFLVGASTFEKGMHVRRMVLGDAHVDRAMNKMNTFNNDFQTFIAHYAWGEIWTRPGLSKQNRSLITMAMLIALNRQPEFKMHVRAAINNGVSVAEIKEVIMQSAIYCGVPAANEAIHAAQEVFTEMDIKIN